MCLHLENLFGGTECKNLFWTLKGQLCHWCAEFFSFLSLHETGISVTERSPLSASSRYKSLQPAPLICTGVAWLALGSLSASKIASPKKWHSSAWNYWRHPVYLAWKKRTRCQLNKIMIIFVGYYHSDVALKRCGDSAFLFVSLAERLLLCEDSKDGALSHWYSWGANILPARVPMGLPPRRNGHAYTSFKRYFFSAHMHACNSPGYRSIVHLGQKVLRGLRIPLWVHFSSC